MDDNKATKEAYNEGTMDDVIWIRRDYNFADAMTKAKILRKLLNVIRTENVNTK